VPTPRLNKNKKRLPREKKRRVAGGWSATDELQGGPEAKEAHDGLFTPARDTEFNTDCNRLLVSVYKEKEKEHNFLSACP